MDNKELLQLIDRVSNGLASDEELRKYNAWCNLLQQEGKAVPDFEEIKSKVFLNINHQIDGANKRYSLWPRIAMAAAAVVAITLGVWFYTGSPIVNRNPQIVNQNDIAPGKNTATLTLANGKTITLSDVKIGVVIDASSLLYNDGSEVERGDPDTGQDLKAIANLTATTPRGGTYQVILPDGTKVWLNAASSLKFPSTFTGTAERRVELMGEAYFEVSKSKQPFIVSTNKQDVKVLGTHFNINAYADQEQTITTLLEGSVRVSGTGIQAVTLLPKQQSILNSKTIMVAAANVEEAVSWKNGYFRFNGEPVESAMQKIARWYNIEVDYDGSVPADGLNGKVSRYKNISQVLMALEATKTVKFKVEGRKVTVMPYQ